MKLNKTLMIAALIAGSVMAADVAVRAQDAATNAPATTRPANRGRMNLDAVAKQLDLTDDQKTKVKPIWDDMMQKMRDLRKDTSLSQEDRRTKMKDIRDDATTKLKDILTPDQLDKWSKMGARQRKPKTPPADAQN